MHVMLGAELAYCWLKIGRAEEHAKTVSDEITTWEDAEPKPYSFTRHRDAQGHRYSITVHFSIPYRDRWALIAGDCIHNLRCALDHFVYAIAVRQTGLNPPADERRLQFPIADNPENFAVQAERIRSLSQAVRTSIELVQPYNRRHGLLPPLLGLVRDFDDRDKHRLLNVSISRQQSGDAQIDCPIGHRVSSMSVNPDDIVNGTEIMAFTVDPPCPNVNYEYETAFTVGFNHPPGPTGIQVSGVRSFLALLCGEVRKIVEVIGEKV